MSGPGANGAGVGARRLVGATARAAISGAW